MRPVPTLFVAALLAGCAAPEETSPAPAVHYADCARDADVETCKSPTERTPLLVRRAADGNASRVSLALLNNGTVPLLFDADPPPVQVYRFVDGAWAKVARPAGGGPGRALDPGEEIPVTLHYGRPEEGAAGDVGHAPMAVPQPWPAAAYRFCASAHPEGEAAWVRGCGSFRVR